jgi:hypothetical protein
MAMRGKASSVLRDRPYWQGTQSLIGLVSTVESVLSATNVSSPMSPTSPVSPFGEKPQGQGGVDASA